MISCRVGACQPPEILGDVDAALSVIEDFARTDAGLLLFPECFLQGYVLDPGLAIDLRSDRFGAILDRLAPLAPALVFGLIEADGPDCFNTAVVVERGRLTGAYRKTRLLPGESMFRGGAAYPVFETHGVRFGINICFDTRFPEPAARVAAGGARLLLVPAQNMMRRETAERWRDEHHRLRIERARETGMWVVSSDVTGVRDDRVAYGPTSVISPAGEVVAQVPLMTTGMATVTIPAEP
jgi:predicted amidohydrolase